jgi:hypothetical protein
MKIEAKFRLVKNYFEINLMNYVLNTGIVNENSEYREEKSSKLI